MNDGTRARVFLSLLTWIAAPAITSAADPTPFAAIARDYETGVRPLLTRFCTGCHSTDDQEGDLDLERFTSLEHVRRSPRVFLKVVEMLDNGEMPPKKKPQPSAAQRKQIRDWARAYLDAEARAGAGDPGSVVLRRLSNVEYNNTVRDLTGIDLQPAREFPVDGAAGEGFTNVGEALAMSPALLDKYVASAKGIAAHAVLLPDGLRFSARATRRDWTDEIVTKIRDLYRRHTAAEGSNRINLQGLVYDTNAGGRIPLEPYLAATLRYRDLRPPAGTPLAAFAVENGLSPKYLQTLWDVFEGQDPSPLIDTLRTRWRGATPGDVPALAAEIRAWQAALTKFNSVAHFKPWMVPVSPLAESQDLRLKLDAAPDAGEVVVRLVTREAGDGRAGDLVEWRQPRLEMPGRAPIALRDLRDGLRGLAAKRKTLGDAAWYLAAVEDARSLPAPIDVEAIAEEYELDPDMLAAWIGYLGIEGRGALKIDGLFTGRREKGGGFDFVNGWGVAGTPEVYANSSDKEAHIPGLVKPHGVVVHPSPTQNVAVGWLSPISGHAKVEARVVHAHPACGNGVSWSLELRRGGERRRLAAEDLNVGQTAKIPTLEKLAIQKGDVLSVVVGPRAGNHFCDLTEVDLTVTEVDGEHRAWVLSRDVSPDILAGNPHADTFGNKDVWNFYQEKITPEGGSKYAVIPGGSLLDRWRDEPERAERDRIAADLQRLLSGEPPAAGDQPDAVLHRQLSSPGGPLLGKLDFGRLAAESAAEGEPGPGDAPGLPRGAFGKHPLGHEVDATSLVTASPSVLEIRLPASLAAGREFVVSAAPDRTDGAEGSVQVQAVVGPAPPDPAGLLPGVPVLTRNGSAARARFEASLDEFRRVFPAALCYSQVVPVDEVVTLVLFHRDDEALERLMLDEAETRTLDRLWDELRYVSQDALRIKEDFGQFMEYVSQDGDVRLFEPLRKPITERAEALRRRMAETEPNHLAFLADFARRAYRRPLTDPERAGLRDLYASLRQQDLDHEAAFRLTLARVLLAPTFLYHAERAAEGTASRPVSDWELASRLSYFLWSTMPDVELFRQAAAGTLHEPAVLEAQTRRMLKDDRVRALATEFACQWLDIRGFDTHDEKSEQVFPDFASLRGAMYEESVRFFVDLFGRDGSVLDVLDADHTFLNDALARHYGIPGVSGPQWRRVDGVKAHGRGGILGMAALLSKQSGASRTSPILRGTWLTEALLGEKLPKPPKNVPQLPESELDTGGLTMRQITAKHTAVESCAKCHDRIDPFGYALEAYDAIGRRRVNDLGGRPVDTQAQLKDGTKFADLPGLRDYVLTKRRDEFLGHFCRKLLGYSLGRSVQLSDEPLLAEITRRMSRNGYRVQDAVLTVVRSPQFLLRRGLESPLEQEASNP